MKALTLVLGMLVVATAGVVFADVLPFSREWLIAVLTAEVAILTVVLVLYASETLKVSRQSLSFFAQPRVSLDCPGGTDCRWNSEVPPLKYYLDTDFAVWNDSAMEIRIERDGLHMPEVLSVEGNAYTLDDVKMSDAPTNQITVDGASPKGQWPATVRKSFCKRCRLLWKHSKAPPQNLQVRIRVRVDYWYRGEQQPSVEREFDFVLHGPAT